MANSEHETLVKKKSFIEGWVVAHPAIQDAKERSEARLAAGMSLVALAWTLVGILSMLAMRGFDIAILFSVLPLAIAYSIAYALCRTPYYIQGIIFLVVAGSINTIVVLAAGVENVASTLFGSILLVFIIGTTLLPKRSSIILVVTDIFLLGLIPFFSSNVTPRDLFRDLLTLLFFGLVLIVTVASRSRTDQERLLEAKQANEKLKILSDALEEHVEDLNERALELEAQSSYLKGAAEVSRAATTFTNAEKLSHQVVEMIRERFSLYYVGLFLTDKNEEWITLQAEASTGRAGETMLAKNYRLKTGTGMIGWAIKHGEPRVASDIGEDAVHFESSELPVTRSEAALPLRSRGRVLGALSVQSNQPAAFTPQIITTLQTMADQVAVAFDNAELLTQSEAALEAERRAYGELSYQSWRSLIQTEDIPAYSIGADGTLKTVSQEENLEEIEAIHEGQIIQEDGRTILLPVKSRGQILGGIRIEKRIENDKWTKEQIQLAETLAEQLSVALESARLFEETQRKAQREAIISDISAKIGASMHLDAILKTTVKELGEALDSPEVTFELVDPAKEDRAS